MPSPDASPWWSAARSSPWAWPSGGESSPACAGRELEESIMLRASLLPLAALLAAAVPCEALDLTGTWVGKQTCRGFDGANFAFKLSESTVEIVQTGNDIALQVLTDAEPDVYRG